MKKVIVEEFGSPDVLKIKDLSTPKPGPGQVVVAITSIGMNHADLMARRGDYIISSGTPPFTPGIEGGGVIAAVGSNVKNRKVGQRVLLGADAPRRNSKPMEDLAYGGTYATHYLLPAEKTVPAPESIPDEQLGAIWLPYLTAWGCLIWKQRIRPGDFIGIPAASSGVGLATAQVAKSAGAIPIGLTTSEEKADKIRALSTNTFDHLITTHDEKGKMTSWNRDLRKLTKRHGIDVFFDPVAAGPYLEMEISALAQHGTIWVFGLLGKPGTVNVTPLIRKMASIRGWYLHELTEHGGYALEEGYRAIINGFEKGIFRQHVAKSFSLDQVAHAHEEMQKGNHIGKLVLIPN